MATQTVVIDISQMKREIRKKQKIEDRLGKSIQKTKNQVLKIDNTRGNLDLKVTDTTIKVLNKIAKGLEREARVLEELPQKTWKMMQLFLKQFDDIIRKTNKLLEKILSRMGYSSNPSNKSITNISMNSYSNVPKAAKVRPKINLSMGKTSDRFQGAIDESIGTGIRISKNVNAGFGELKKGAQPLKKPIKSLGIRVGNELAANIGTAGLALGTNMKVRGAAAETSLHYKGRRVTRSIQGAGVRGEANLVGFGASLESGIKGFGLYLKTVFTNAGSSMGGTVGGFLTSFGGVLETGMRTLGTAANSVFKAAGSGFKKAFSRIGIFAGHFVQNLGHALKKVGDKMGDKIIGITANIKNIAKGAFGIASMIGGIVKGIVGGIVGFFQNLMKAAWEGIKNWGIKPMMQYETTMGSAQGYQYLFAKKGLSSNEFETKLDNEIVVDSPYARENIHNLAKGYYNVSSTGNVDEIISDMKWTQDIAAAFGVSSEGYGNILSTVAQNKNNESVMTLEDMQSMFGDFPSLELFTAALEKGKVSDETMKKTAERVKNGDFTTKDIIKGLEFAATMEDPIEITLDKYASEQNAKKILEGPVKGAAKALADGSISGLQVKLANLFDSKIMSKWGTGLAMGMGKGLASFGEFLDNHKEDIENIGIYLQGVGESITNSLSSALTVTFSNINDLISSEEFQNATPDEKMQMFWKQIIQDPFERWWKDSGEPLVNSIMFSIAKFAGQGLTGFLTILFSMGTEDAVGDGAKAGAGFSAGFAEGFNGEKVWEAFSGMIERIVDVLWDALMEKMFGKQDPNANVTNASDYVDEDGKYKKGVDPKKMNVVSADPIYGGNTEVMLYEDILDTSNSSGLNAALAIPVALNFGELVYEQQVQLIKDEITEKLQQIDPNLNFDKGIEGYGRFDDVQQDVLDAGLEKLRMCNELFGILAQPKYIDIVMRTTGGSEQTTTNIPGTSAISSFASSIFNKVSSVFGGGGDSPSNGDSENVDPEGAYAKGGILTKPHIGLVAEAGPEAVIPLSGAYKNNGISLWEKAGYLLGTLPKHAEGGIFGEIDEEKNGRAYFSLANNKEQEENSSQWISNMTAPVQVNLGGMTFNFHGAEAKDQESIMNVIKQQMPTIADEIAGTIAVNIQRIFSNMKKETV